MSAQIHDLPSAPLVSEIAHNWKILGRRVRHRHLGTYGRLTGAMRWERDALWLDVDTNAGTYFWIARSVDELGPIPLPMIGRAG